MRMHAQRVALAGVALALVAASGGSAFATGHKMSTVPDERAAVEPTAVESAAVAPSARGTVWLCKPGQRPNPCRGSLTTTVAKPDGSTRVREVTRDKRRLVDCFYVYPTVSEEPAPNSDLVVGPQERSIARYQAARFSQVCRVFAPMYRQITLGGLGTASPADREKAYTDVRRAWRQYMARYNNGRGVVLIGHSQGSSVLRRLMQERIDDRPRVRSRFVSAMLTGSSVAVPPGQLVGGDFQNIPGCTNAAQVGCVISYATYNQTPPDDALFGKVRFLPGTDTPNDGTVEALCTNPAALGGGTGSMRTLVRGTPMYGALGVAQQIMYGGSVPTADTPWLRPADRYRSTCRSGNGARYLMVRGIQGAQVLNPSPTPGWGLHLGDVNLPLGNLVSVVRQQARAFNAPMK